MSKWILIPATLILVPASAVLGFYAMFAGAMLFGAPGSNGNIWNHLVAYLFWLLPLGVWVGLYWAWYRRDSKLWSGLSLGLAFAPPLALFVFIWLTKNF